MNGVCRFHTISTHISNQVTQPLWISISAALTLGPIANIYRVTSVYACHEFEKYNEGSAGVIGNIMNTSCIPLTAIFAFIFYGEVMKPIEFIGSAIVCVAILIVTGGKAKK